MKKSSKQKKNNQKNKKRQNKKQHGNKHVPKIPIKPNEQEVQVAPDDVEGETVAVDEQAASAPAVTGINPIAPTTVAERQAALLARQQRTQWNQQRKMGKMAGAQVGKRFNRGG